MAQVQFNIEIGTKNKTAANKKGCMNVPLIDCIKVNSYVFPVLHLMIGLGNMVVKIFFQWSNQRVEMIPKDEMRAHKEWLKSIHAMEKEEEDLNE